MELPTIMAKKVLNETNIQNQNMFFTLKNVFLACVPGMRMGYRVEVPNSEGHCNC